MRPHIVSLAAIVMAGTLSAANAADVSVNVNVGVPNVVFQTPPQMVWAPQSGLYVAYGSPQALFFVGGNYYVYDRGRWYVSVTYQGPWGEVRVDTLPRPLYGYRDQDWGRYQHEAEHHHRHDDDDREHPSFYARRDGEHSGHAYGHDKQKDKEKHKRKHEDDD